ncbi:MAG TPA: AMP-binding protein, partial [Ilumatobacteraceae bacterium]|nr:AMP-binding protein [Ilumatobacteraceae bacterium]
MTSILHEQPLLPHLVVTALESRSNEPCIFTGAGASGDAPGAASVLTYGQVRDRTSQMVQAMRSLGVGRGAHLAILSKNRPEVLLNACATLVNGCILTPLHPMASLGDHSYAVRDAEIDCLVFDAAHFTERAAELRDQYPDLVLLGFGPNAAGHDYLALADTFSPQPLVAPDVHLDDLCTIVYTGGTTGRPKGVLMTHRVWQSMTWIQMAEWEFPTEIRIALPTPLS